MTASVLQLTGSELYLQCTMFCLELDLEWKLGRKVMTFGEELAESVDLGWVGGGWG